MTPHPHTPDSFPYPTGSVVGILADTPALDTARERLTAAGFDVDRCEVLHGEADLSRIDVDGSAHGASGLWRRRLQAAFSDEADHARRYADGLRAGHYVVGIPVGEDHAAKGRAAGALQDARAEYVHYYAENYVEDLDR